MQLQPDERVAATEAAFPSLRVVSGAAQMPSYEIQLIWGKTIFMNLVGYLCRQSKAMT